MKGFHLFKSSNSLLDSKFNYFVEYFNFYIEMVGLLYDMELDNPITTINKIIYQLESNYIEGRYYSYIPIHFEKIKKQYSSLINVYVSYQQAHLKINEYLNRDKQGRSTYLDQNRISLIQMFKELEDELREKLVIDSIYKIMAIVNNSSPLNEVSHEIRKLTQVVATESIFKIGDKKEVIKLFSNYFSIHKYPYPEDLKSVDEREKYFNEKSTVQRLESFGSMVKDALSPRYFLFKVEGLIVPDGYEFAHFENRIISPQNPQIQGLNEQLLNWDREKLKEIFIDNPYAYCVVKSTHHSREIAHKNALRKSRITIDYINTVLDKDYILDRRNYVFTNDFQDFSYRIQSRRKDIEIDDLEIQIIEDNAYEYFKNNVAVCSTSFLEYETNFLEARTDRNPSKLWQHLEVLLQPKLRGENNVKEIVSSALTTSEIKIRSRRLKNYLKGIVRHCQFAGIDINLSHAEIYSFLNNESDVSILANKVNSPIFYHILKLMNKEFNNKTYCSIYASHINLFTQAYEQRNMIEHAWIMQERAGISLYFSLLDKIVLFRWVIFDYAKRHPGDTLDQIINRVMLEANSLKGQIVTANTLQ